MSSSYPLPPTFRKDELMNTTDLFRAAVNMLDVVILGATEVDRDVNVNTDADGALLHGIGGHQDTAAGAKLTIIAQPLLRGRIPCVTDTVYSVTTPGECVDAAPTWSRRAGGSGTRR